MADWVWKIVLARGAVGSGGGNAERVGYIADSGRSSSRALTICSR